MRASIRLMAQATISPAGLRDSCVTPLPGEDILGQSPSIFQASAAVPEVVFMPVPFQCAECGFKSQVKDELQGKKIKCPKCQAVGLAGAAPKAKARAKAGAGSDDPFDNLMNMNLDSLEEEDLGSVGDKAYRDPEDRPKKKKDKKEASKGAPGINSGALTGVIISMIAALGIVGYGAYVVLPGMLSGTKVEPPTQFERIHHLYGEFYVEVPADWKREESPNKPDVPEWLKVSQGSAVIEIRFDDSGTFVANAAGAGGNVTEMSQTMAAAGGRTMTTNNADPAPVRSLHDATGEAYAKAYRNFEDGNTANYDMQYGDARMATCTFVEGIGTKMKAMRISVYNGSKAWKILCRAREADFDALKPAFEKVVQSMEGVEPKF